MLGLGFPEIVFILVVAAIILGPEHMPRAANMLGKWSAKLRSAATSFGEALANDEDLREIQSTVQEVKTELDSVRSEWTAAKNEVLGISNSAQSAFEEARRELKDLGRLPKDTPNTSSSTDLEDDENTHVPTNLTKSDIRPAGFTTPSLNDESSQIPTLQTVKLTPPILLPGEISRQVARYRIALPKVNATACTSAQCPHLLSPTQTHAPFLKIRRLEKAQHGDSQAMHSVALTKHVNRGAQNV